MLVVDGCGCGGCGGGGGSGGDGVVAEVDVGDGGSQTRVVEV